MESHDPDDLIHPSHAEALLYHPNKSKNAPCISSWEATHGQVVYVVTTSTVLSRVGGGAHVLTPASRPALLVDLPQCDAFQSPFR